MDDAITTGNCIFEDIKIGLVLRKIPEYWGTFINLHSSTTTSQKNNAQPVAITVSINRFQRGHPANQQRDRPDKVRNSEIV